MRIGQRPPVLAAMLLAGIAAWSVTGVSRSAAAVVERYVTVVDDEGRPVQGLTEEDFALRDGGIRQHVLDVAPATAPVAIALVSAGFGVTEGRQPAEALAAAARQLRNANGAAGLVIPISTASRPQVVDALTAACAALHAAPTDRRVLLAIIRRQAGDGTATDSAKLTEAIFQSRASLWTIEVGPAQKTALDGALSEASDLGGALRQTVAAGTDLMRVTQKMLPLVTTQYVVSYEWPDPVLSVFNLTIRHERGAVLTPAWVR